jgi:putative hydrolase of the HAD superfamily
MNIETIIFDLGGVLYDIDHKKTFDALAKLSDKPHRIDFSIQSQNDIFTSFEKGKVSPAQFRNELRSFFGITADDATIDNAWNAMLVGLFPSTIDIIRKLRTRYRVALLSNINDIHCRAIEHQCLPLFLELHDCFLSYTIGLRKPEPEIYHYVLNAMDIVPETTVFIDDAPQNIAAAQAIGIKTFHFTPNSSLSSVITSISA